MPIPHCIRMNITIERFFLTVWFCAFSGIFTLCPASIPKTTPKGVKTIVIDPGHGGNDPGCNGSQYFEKDICLAIGLKLGELIEKNMPEVKVIFTRKKDMFVALEERAQIANRNEADLFISIHCNAAAVYATYKDKKGRIHYKTFKDKKGKIRKVEVHNPKPYGSGTYVMGISNEKGKLNTAKRENASILLEDNYEKTYNGFDPESDEAYIVMSLWTGAFVEKSADLGVRIQKEYEEKAGRLNKGVMRQSLWVLWRTAMPGVLTEVGFLTNPEEEKFLASENGQFYLASAIFRAVRCYKDAQEGTIRKYDDELTKQSPLQNENILKGNKAETEGTVQDSLTIAAIMTDEKYEHLIKSADSLLKLKKYEEAGSVYKTASDLKPEEKYPLWRIDDCNKRAIAEKEKDKSIPPNVKKDSTVTEKKQDPPDIRENNSKTNPDITFRVQFAVSDAEPDFKEGKFKEIKDPGFYQSGIMFKITAGNFNKSSEAVNLQNAMRRQGFPDAFVVAFKSGQRIDYNEAIRILKSN